jgi:AcrR family transcriptional regulator
MRPLPAVRDTRNVTLDAAETVLATMGVANLTFEEVAREAGVSKGGVLYHFLSKEALTEAMIERLIERFDTAVTDAAESDRRSVGRNILPMCARRWASPP